ncbi:MAG: hypothetical protein WCK67_05625 [bacterium]
MNNRWYDSNPKTNQLLGLLNKIPLEIQDELSKMIINFVNLYRKNRSPEETPISIGKERVLGMYQASNKRRWYDSNAALLSTMNIIATLPEQDYKNLIDGILETLKEYNIK